MSERDHELLGVAIDARPEELRGAYRRAVRRTHPDCGGDAERFDLITGAYERLVRAQHSNGNSSCVEIRFYRSPRGVQRVVAALDALTDRGRRKMRAGRFGSVGPLAKSQRRS
jgi:DnaJ domain